MKTLFIPAKVRLDINEKEINAISKQLPKNLAIVYSIQYEDVAFRIRKILSKNHEITKFTQVLGCSKTNFPKNTQAILLITDGKFHAIPLAFETKLPIYVLENNKLKKLPKKEIENFKKRKKAAHLKFLNAKKVGILISIKPGQENLKKALKLKKILKKKFTDKTFYLFLGNEFNSQEFENFPEIQSWINAACPRLDFDASVINLGDKV